MPVGASIFAELRRICGTLAWAAVLTLIVSASPAFGQTAPNSAGTNHAIASPEAHRRGSSAGTHVYLLRGLMNVFSLGMDDLAARIQRRGVAASVHNHAEWQSLADDIAAAYRSGRRDKIVLIGHSFGADAVMLMAERLGTLGVPVSLVVPFDGTGSYAASANVRQVFNITQRDYALMRRGPGFRGQLVNLDVSNDPDIDHLNIDKSPRLHGMVVARILAIAGKSAQSPSHTRQNGMN